MLNILLLAMTTVTAQDASGAVTQASPRSMRLKLVNAGAHRLRAVYASPSNQPGWGDNLLATKERGQARAGTAPGLAGAARTEVRVTGACGLYDVRIVGEKGAEFLLDEVELCEDGDVLTVTDRALTHVKLRDLQQREQP
jgi:hypothetical protein